MYMCRYYNVIVFKAIYFSLSNQMYASSMLLLFLENTTFQTLHAKLTGNGSHDNNQLV